MGLANRFSGLPRFKDDVYVRDRITTGEQSLVRVLLGGKRLLTRRDDPAETSGMAPADD